MFTTFEEWLAGLPDDERLALCHRDVWDAALQAQRNAADTTIAKENRRVAAAYAELNEKLAGASTLEEVIHACTPHEKTDSSIS